MNYASFKLGSIIILAILLQLFFGCLNALAKRNDKATVEPVEMHMKDGLKKMKAGNYEEASDEFLQACYFARNKYCPEGWLYLGLCYKSMRNYSKAVEALLNHLKQTTEPAADAHVDLAECYLNIGEYGKAEYQVTQARIDAATSNKRPWYAMGELAEKMNKPGEALDAYNEALGEKPWHYTEAWMGRCRALMKLTPPNYNQALRDYRGIIESGAKTDFVELYYNMAQCLYKRGDHQGAIDHLLEALKCNPDHFDSHLALARIFDEEKHVTSSINQYEHALRTAPKGYDTDQINKRIVYMQGQISSQEKEKEIKPTPYMRQEQQQLQQGQQQQQQAPKGDSGF